MGLTVKEKCTLYLPYVMAVVCCVLAIYYLILSHASAIELEKLKREAIFDESNKELKLRIISTETHIDFLKITAEAMLILQILYLVLNSFPGMRKREERAIAALDV